jgi:hypothetical protein
MTVTEISATEDIPRQTAIIQTLLSVELDHQTLFQFTGTLSHDLNIAILEYMIPPDVDLAETRLGAHCRLTPEIDELPPEVALVLRRHAGIGIE